MSVDDGIDIHDNSNTNDNIEPDSSWRTISNLTVVERRRATALIWPVWLICSVFSSSSFSSKFWYRSGNSCILSFEFWFPHCHSYFDLISMCCGVLHIFDSKISKGILPIFYMTWQSYFCVTILHMTFQSDFFSLFDFDMRSWYIRLENIEVYFAGFHMTCQMVFESKKFMGNTKYVQVWRYLELFLLFLRKPYFCYRLSLLLKEVKFFSYCLIN